MVSVDVNRHVYVPPAVSVCVGRDSRRTRGRRNSGPFLSRPSFLFVCLFVVVVVVENPSELTHFFPPHSSETEQGPERSGRSNTQGS